jgi:hypothetical protein
VDIVHQPVQDRIGERVPPLYWPIVAPYSWNSPHGLSVNFTVILRLHIQLSGSIPSFYTNSFSTRILDINNCGYLDCN